MKKLLIFSLVLAMASVVSAATVIDIDVNGVAWAGDDVKPSDIISVTISDDEVHSGYLETLLSFSNGDYEDETFVMDGVGWLIYGGQINDQTEGFDAYFNGSVLMPRAADDVYTLDFHVPNYKEASDWIIIDATGGTWDGITAAAGDADGLPYVAIHVIPEPATIVLLGLGGLLLRRRK